MTKQVGSYARVLKTRSFLALLVTYFLGAMNDNIYKIVVTLFAVSQGKAHGGALSLAAVLFILPSLLFSGYAGHLADVHSKHKVLMITKTLEIVIMLLAWWVLDINNYLLMVSVLFLIAAQAVFFTPAKYAIVPEILPTEELSRANGLLEMATFVAIIVGTGIGGILMQFFRYQVDIIAFVMIAIAIIGSVCSLGIKPVPAAAKPKDMHGNPFKEIMIGFKRVKGDRELLTTVLGISFFWCLAVATQITIILYGSEVMKLGDDGLAFLNVVVGLGIGIGSILAGWASGDKIELGFIIPSCIGMAIGALLLTVAASSMWMVTLGIFILGCAAGFYIVPFNALLQERPNANEKGVIIATNNFVSGCTMLVSAVLVGKVFDEMLGISAQAMFFWIAVFTLVMMLALMRLLPSLRERAFFWCRNNE